MLPGRIMRLQKKPRERHLSRLWWLSFSRRAVRQTSYILSLFLSLKSTFTSLKSGLTTDAFSLFYFSLLRINFVIVFKDGLPVVRNLKYEYRQTDQLTYTYTDLLTAWLRICSSEGKKIFSLTTSSFLISFNLFSSWQSIHRVYLIYII